MLSVDSSRDSAGNLSDESIGPWGSLLVLGIFSWEHKNLISQPLRLWWPGLLLVVFGMVLHVIGYFIQQPRLSIVALLTGIYGLMGMAWGREWLRRIFFSK